MEDKIENINKIIIKDIENKMKNNGTTFSSDLNNMGNSLFKKCWKGVMPKDMFRGLDNNEYAILNVDTSSQPGSHWIAIAKKNDKYYAYDSFGRPFDILMKIKGYGKIKTDTKDAEQKISEKNCGQRCLAWLLIFKYYGPEKAMLI